ncbi:MAG: hypothetical protein ABJO57_10085 [Lentilitoribacter sp.]
MQKISSPTSAYYNAGHPWYYFLGGTILKPKQILENTRESGYKGYLRDDIAAIDKKLEPARSHKLRRIKANTIKKLKSDLAVYRQCALQLHRHPKTELPIKAVMACNDIHTAISLKHNHLVNDFAHLITINDLLYRQGNLFGF